MPELSADDLAVAQQLAPTLHLDAREPFGIAAVGVEVHRDSAGALEGGNATELRGLPRAHGVRVVYQLLWSADIGHVREVERIVVESDMDPQVQPPMCRVRNTEVSAHGVMRSRAGGQQPVDIWVEPGKHGMAFAPENFALPNDVINWMCGPAAGWDGLHFHSGEVRASPFDDRRSMRALAELSFRPAWEFSRRIEVAKLPWIPTDELLTRIDRHSAEFIAGKSGAVLAWRSGPWESGERIVLARAEWRDDGWWCDRVEFSHRCRELRGLQRLLVLHVEQAGAEHMSELWQTAWDHYCSSFIIVVGDESVIQLATDIGFHTALAVERLPNAEPTPRWVWVADRALCEQWMDHALVIGPGPADILTSAASGEASAAGVRRD